MENKVIGILVVFIFSMLRIKIYPKQKQKLTPESIPLSIGKTINNLWSHRLYETIVKLQVTDKCPDKFFLQINALEKNKVGIMSIWEWGYYS